MSLPVVGRSPRRLPGRHQGFVQGVLDWYGHHRRDLPWRRTRDPYRILLSEIMLQQTQVARVIPKYREFLRKYPSLRALARAPLRRVKQIWYPLGYNIRPVRLHRIARAAVADYHGHLPRGRDELLGLPGIGPYTAAAVATFAHGQPAPILETNVRRLLRRVFYGGRQIPDRALWRLSATLLPKRRGYDFNQALMDFGALVCTARAPRCGACPLHHFCRAYPRLRIMRPPS